MARGLGRGGLARVGLQRQRQDLLQAVGQAVALEDAARELECMSRGYDGYGCKVLNDGAARIRSLASN